jgi:hypothetical protein
MGPITIHEQIDFHFQLDDLSSLGEQVQPDESTRKA